MVEIRASTENDMIRASIDNVEIRASTENDRIRASTGNVEIRASTGKGRNPGRVPKMIGSGRVPVM